MQKIPSESSWKAEVIPGYTGYMQGIGQGTASLMGTYENCRKKATDATVKSRFGSSFNPERSHSLSPNAMYRGANPRMKTNSKNRSSIMWGDDRDLQWTTMNSMQYLPHGELTQGGDDHDISGMTQAERRKLYAQAQARVGAEGIKIVEAAMTEKLSQRSSSGSLRSAFKYFDRDGSGTIDLVEFFKVLEFMGLTFDEHQVIALFGHFDRDNAEGELDYNLFVERVMMNSAAGPNADYVSHAVADRTKRLGKAVCVKIGQDSTKVARMDVKRIFSAFDFDKNDAIDKKEMGALLHAIGVTGMSKLEINAIVSRLDKSKTGMVEFDEFWKWFQEDNKTAGVLHARY